MKHIGILAHSADGAILPMGPILAAYDRGPCRHAYLTRTCQRLADAGGRPFFVRRA